MYNPAFDVVNATMDLAHPPGGRPGKPATDRHLSACLRHFREQKTYRHLNLLTIRIPARWDESGNWQACFDQTGDPVLAHLQTLLADARQIQPGLPILASLCFAETDGYHPIFQNETAGEPENARRFARQTLEWLRQFDLEGLDLPWTSAAAPLNPRQLPKILEALRTAFDRESLSSKRHHYLTLSPETHQGLEADAINQHLDFLNLPPIPAPDLHPNLLQMGIDPDLIALGVDLSDPAQNSETTWRTMRSHPYHVVTHWHLNSQRYPEAAQQLQALSNLRQGQNQSKKD